MYIHICVPARVLIGATSQNISMHVNIKAQYNALINVLTILDKTT